MKESERFSVVVHSTITNFTHFPLLGHKLHHLVASSGKKRIATIQQMPCSEKIH